MVGNKSRVEIVSHTTKKRNRPSQTEAWVRLLYTHLSTIGEESGFLVIQLDGLCVQVDGTNVVARGEGLVALVLEINSFLRHDGSLASCAGRSERARSGEGEAQTNEM